MRQKNKIKSNVVIKKKNRKPDSASPCSECGRRLTFSYPKEKPNTLKHITKSIFKGLDF